MEKLLQKQKTLGHFLSERNALTFFHQIVKGVEFLHAHGIAHRDLSLDNVLLQNNSCKICDFGLSTDATTLSDEPVGKLLYMAPEAVACSASHSQSRCGYDPKAADMWSLGVMLLLLLTGAPSLSFDSATTLYHSLTGGMDRMELIGGGGVELTRETTQLLARLLEIEPKCRITSAKLLEQLEQLSLTDQDDEHTAGA